MFMACKFLTAVALLISFASASQVTKKAFQLSAPARRVGHTLYNTIRLVDIRKDPDDFGLAQVGLINKPVPVVAETPFDEQLKKAMRQMIFSTDKDGELVLVLRQLSFAELHNPYSEKGYCHFRATLFGGSEGKYRKLDMIDTAVFVKAVDVTQPMFREGSRVITDFIADNLIQLPADSQVYSLNELNYIDIIEKKQLPAYNVRIFPNGIYRTFADFANMQPVEAELKVDISNNGKVRSAKKKNAAGKFEPLLLSEAYAFVFEGKPYILTEYDYYPMERKIGDFYFTGRVKNLGGEDNIVNAAIFFGIAGALLASEGSSFFEIKIDHVTGGFIRLREASRK